MNGSAALVGYIAAASIVLLFVLGGLATPTDHDWLRSRTGVSRGVAGGIVVVLLVLVGALGVVGRFPRTEAGLEAAFLPGVLVGVGLFGLAVGVANGRTWVRFRRRGDTPTGEVAPGPVAVTGRIERADPPTAPFFGGPAVAWEWSVEAKNRHGTNDEGRRAWSRARTGQGGVPFRLDDGSGPVVVDPTAARLDVSGKTTEERAPDDPPGRAAAVADLDMGGERFRFNERSLAPGETVTVLGVARDVETNEYRSDAGTGAADRLASDRGAGVVLDASADEPFVVSDRSRAGTRRRYATRAWLGGVVGAGTVALGLRWLLPVFEVPVPV
ncbi:E3 ubiquitin ligase family protein [Haloglomus halophilum]|uniref:E3 ubiquitin ligase family protein n=1 Tax=Haloglomus halophilum TaxID=2962672 RepID=UPI0020C9475B|nr:E3 ubiquitin ligase family protein [Haloglomus halophilum]